ncbi:RHS repeat-associated core domain-containing protein [Acidovorax sp. NCPPB 4044]|uniref:RHS repeat-associated core domain-containing protein n=1 Tax=Acidovorax sp. NCPPB 4044 TaxID=2940490 RepID=UPI002302C7CF|nr:RHS repeat-associated core domain-containing protein [Acidovorax sp. NCPPB 4044]MDA8522169.1 DUF6531 domain-containing protein [Acidovorax sp. NCPPB 4044]
MSGKPAARQGDLTKKGGPIVQGSATVLIGSAGGVACSECPGGMAVGSPVNPSLGAKVLTGGDDLDFALPGPMTLVWQRVYSSYVNTEHGSACGLLGHGWKLPMELRLEWAGERTVLFDASGRAIAFEEPLEPGQALYSASENLWLLRGGGTVQEEAPPGQPAIGASGTVAPELRPWTLQPRWAHLPLHLRADPACVIATPGTGAPASAWIFLPAANKTAVSGTHVLHEVRDRFGRSQRYARGESGPQQGRIVRITDGSGRSYALLYERIAPEPTAAGAARAPLPASAHPLLGPDDGMRLIGVDCTAPANGPDTVPGVAPAQPQPLVRYRYDTAGNLAEVLGQDGTLLRCFGYDDLHRMTAHRVRQGPWHRYVYEDQAPQSRQPPRPGARVVEQHNEEGLSYRFDYLDPPPPDSAPATPPVSRTLVHDSLGRTTEYHFEGEGGLKRLVRLVGPDGAEQRWRHDSAGRRIAATDALGRTTWWRYDGAGRLLGVQHPDGRSGPEQRWGEDGSAQDGLLLQSRDAAGSRTHYRYDAWGRLVEVAVLPAGSEGAEPGAETEARALVTRLEYAQPQADGRFAPSALPWCDQPVAVVDAQGGRSEFAYDACGQLARRTDCSGRSHSLRHGAWGELLEEVDALGQRTHYRHALAHGALRLIGVQYPGNTAVRYRWAQGGLLAAITHGTHDVLEATGTASGTSTTVTYRHDLWGRVIEQAQAGRGVQLRYDTAGRLVELVNENGEATRFVHDAADRLVQEVGFDGRSQVFGHDAAGQLVQTSDGQGPGHRPSAESSTPGSTPGDAVRSRLHYDLRGRLVARVLVRLPAGEQDTGPAAAWEHDGDALLQIHRFDHAPSGALASVRTWQGRLPHTHEPMQAGALGRSAALGSRAPSLSAHWLALDTQPLLALLDRPGDPALAEVAATLQAHRMALDSRVALARDGLGRACGETQTLYSKVGSEPMGGEPPVEFEHTIAHTLGPLGQRTATRAQGLGTLQWLAYGSGHVHGLLLDGDALVDWERDGLHREVGRTLRILGENDEAPAAHADLQAIIHARRLDPMGRMLHQDWRGLRHAPAETHAHAHAAAASGRIAPALGPLATLAQRRYDYDPLGQLVGVRTPGEATRYGYDAWQRLTGLQRATQAGAAQEHWALDAAGNRLPAPADARAQAPHADRQRQRQDWAQQVRENLRDTNFDLLSGGTSAGEGPGTVTHWPGNRIGWSTAPEGRGNAAGTTHYRYDAFGNRTLALLPGGRAQRLRYDALHQLREVWQRESAASPWCLLARYRYDAFGRRLAKTVYDQARQQGTTTHAGWDGDRLVHTEGPGGLLHTLYEPHSFVPLLRLERQRAVPSALQALLALQDPEDANAPARDFLAALPRSQRELLVNTLSAAIAPGSPAPATRQLPAEVGALLAAGLDEVRNRQATSARTEATRIRHILCDHLGTPIALVDANGPQAGLVTWAATHHAWGAVREEYDPYGIGQNIRFQGQQLDAETGLHYNRFRYYDPAVGQYVTQDPIGLVGGNNFYRYVERPTTYIDPLGLTGNAHQRAVKRGEVSRQTAIDAQTAGMLETPSHPLDKVYDTINPNDKVWKKVSPYDYTQYCKKWSKSKLTCQPGDKEPGKDVKTPADYIPEESMWKSSELPKGYECDSPVYFKDLQERGTAPTADTDDLMDLANKMRQRRGSRK